MKKHTLRHETAWYHWFLPLIKTQKTTAKGSGYVLTAMPLEK
jgi:hypothetical protein